MATCSMCGTLVPAVLEASSSSICGGRLHVSSATLPQSFSRCVVVKAAGQEKGDKGDEKKENKQSLFTSLTDALDFAQVRSQEDANLLEDAREATQSGEKMSREQYAALRRKIGGTYRDFFKDSIDVDGVYVDDGWVDKTCRFAEKIQGPHPALLTD